MKKRNKITIEELIARDNKIGMSDQDKKFILSQPFRSDNIAWWLKKTFQECGAYGTPVPVIDDMHNLYSVDTKQKCYHIYVPDNTMGEITLKWNSQNNDVDN